MKGATRPRRGARLAVLGATTLAAGLLPLAAGATTPPTPAPGASGAASATGTASASGSATASAPTSTPASTPAGGTPSAPRTLPAPGGPSARGPAPGGPSRTAPTAGAGKPARGKAAAGGARPCPPTPTGRLDHTRFNPNPPDGSIYLSGAGFVTCAYVVGYSDVRKLGEAMIVNDPSKQPLLTALDVGARVVYEPVSGYYELGTLGALTLPDSDSTFLTFGFTPTTAKVHYVVDSPLTINGIQQTVNDPVITTVSYYMHLQIHDVRVNGVPLDVGGNCRTGGFHVVLTGRNDKGYDMFAGGRLTGTIDVPSFTGCVSRGQDLDPLFTATISGPGNYLDMTQSGLCADTADCASSDNGNVPLLPPALPSY